MDTRELLLDGDQIPAYGLRQLKARHFKIMDLQLEGLPLSEIAMTMGMSVQSLYYITSSPLYRAELEKRLNAKNMEVNDFLAAHQMEAAKVGIELMRNSRSEKLRWNIAAHILAINGHSPVSRSQNEVAHKISFGKVLEEAWQQIQERRRLCSPSEQEDGQEITLGRIEEG